MKMIAGKQAPAVIGTYSQVVQVNNTVYLSGQIALDPLTNELVSAEFKPQLMQVFANLNAVVAVKSLQQQALVEIDGIISL